MDISKKYVKLKDQREHLLLKPDMYIGSVKPDFIETFLANDCGNGMVKSTIQYIPGMFKIFDEIVANAIDQSIRLKERSDAGEKGVKCVTTLKINIDVETGFIKVYNDGEGIEVVEHEEHKIYIPELIFGNLLTSSNYDDKQQRIVQGTNGIGCKACNIMSSSFSLETLDHNRKLVYKQTFTDNMSITGKPNIKKATSKTPYTMVTFKPDYQRFGVCGLSAEMFQVMRKRVFDICAVVHNKVKIYFNDTLIDYAPFTKYVDLYIGDKKEHERVYEQVNDRWEVVASYSDFDGFQQISFVNGLLTINGGTHVKYIVDQIVKHITQFIKTKHKIDVKPQTVRENLMIFIKCTVDNPTFNSQSKEALTTPSSLFGSTAKLGEAFLKKMCNSTLVTQIINLSSVNETKSLKKTDGKKLSVIRGIPKLEDAIWAGTAKSSECTIIFTEGDSAASMALAGLSEVGREKYGVFPLKGKVMNVKDATTKKIAENTEITNIKKIVGLESGKDYTDIKSLRYGKIMLMTDSDCDGTHIKGLIFNLFHSLWPSILKSGIVLSMLTPIIKVRKGLQPTINFYNMTNYETWRDNLPEGEIKSWKVKYYKGLGTSTNQEAKEYFKEMRTLKYDFTDDAPLDLAFNKKKADDRKKWLSSYDRQNVLDYTCETVSCEDFINKDFIHFSNYDVERSIPSICDGLKYSHRKILYSCLKRNLFKDELRVSQLAGYVSVDSAYHHGEASLQAAIVGMAQDFIGSNNINLLLPNGQFGSRVHGGKDAGQPRYIHTQLSPIVTKLFIKSDTNILENMEDNGLVVEPTHYIPIIPMILVNGACGIGTGFSTNIPCYNPKELINSLVYMLENNGTMKRNERLHPFYQLFNGNIIEQSKNKYVSKGIWKRVSPTIIKITELPVGTWTFDYKEDLEILLDKLPEFKKYENKSAETIEIDLYFTSSDAVDKLIVTDANGVANLETIFKLISPKGLTTTNMYLFNEKGQITKYSNVGEIIKAFYNIRLSCYEKRKVHIIYALNKELDVLKNKVRFVQQVVKNEIPVMKMKKDELIGDLQKRKYMKHGDSYEYLTRIPIYNFTMDKVTELEAEMKKLLSELKYTTGRTPQQMWRDELDALASVI
jgi:DNA topoisomerase-2